MTSRNESARCVTCQDDRIGPTTTAHGSSGFRSLPDENICTPPEFHWTPSRVISSGTSGTSGTEDAFYLAMAQARRFHASGLPAAANLSLRRAASLIPELLEDPPAPPPEPCWKREIREELERRRARRTS